MTGPAPSHGPAPEPGPTRAGQTPAADPVAVAVAAALRAAGCVFAEDEAELLLAATSSAPGKDALDRLVARRVAGEPLEQILGWAELAGVRVAVAPGVFVPRRRSALLVREAAAAAMLRRPIAASLSNVVRRRAPAARRRIRRHPWRSASTRRPATRA